MPDNKPQLRATLRQRRRRLTPSQQRHAGEALAARLCRQSFFLRARRIAFYFASDGEIDPHTTMEIARAAGKQVYLPVLQPFSHGRLYFVRHQSGEQLAANRYGIPEPALSRAARVPVWALDIIFMPLVGFAADGNRLGMGGGFYDKTLARGLGRRHPLLVGLAHHFQQVDRLPADSWDIPLHYIATDRGLIDCRRAPSR